MLTQIETLPQYLLKLSQQQATGELLIPDRGTQGDPWKLYFYSGRLVYATGGIHTVRRWYRALRQHASDFNMAWLRQMQTPDDYWEIDFINQAIKQNHITLNQGKGMIKRIVYEVIVSLMDVPLDAPRWQENRLVGQQAVFLSVEQLLYQAQQTYQQWQATSLEYLPKLSPQQLPYLAPLIKDKFELQAKLDPKVFQRLEVLTQGNTTLWDIAVQTRRLLPEVIQQLLPLVKKGYIRLVSIPDLAAPYKPRPTSVSVESPVSKGLIACIDDSPLVSKTLANILQPVGYEILPIIHPLQQISMLLQHKPDLIFLDLIMPNVNGYELCTFLRKTTAFQAVPIVILTGRDGVIDRVRTKMAGCSDFLAKPPDAKKVLQIVEKHLQKLQSDSSESSSLS